MLNARALACGIIAAVVLVSAYTWTDATIAGGNALLTPVGAMQAAAVFSALIALEILIICVPVWLLIERLGWANLPVAAGLGFVAPPVYWLLNNWLEGGDPVLGPASDTIAYAVCGAAAGLTIWLTRPKRSDQADVAA